MSDFNIRSLDTAKCADEGIVYFLRHPESNEKLPLWVKIKGADSEAFQRVADASTNEVFKQIAKTGKVQRTAVESREEKVKAVCDMVIEWGGGFEGDCDDENKLKFFGWRGYGWALDQVNTQILDRANFLPK